MHFIYDDNSVRTAFSSSVSYNDINAVAKWARHFANSMQLKFFMQHGTTQEKLQAQHELAICERKMTYWQRHPNYSVQAAAQQATEIKKQWASTK
jgi:hypothetical protein